MGFGIGSIFAFLLGGYGGPPVAFNAGSGRVRFSGGGGATCFTTVTVCDDFNLSFLDDPTEVPKEVLGIASSSEEEDWKNNKRNI